jgi:branched-chain amino acid transport system ATP-binding protein
MPTSSAEPKQSVAAADAVVLRQIEAGYEHGIPVIKGVSASFRTGQISAVLGVNGAGKSTLMKAVAGLVSVYSGSIIINGADVTGSNATVLAKRGLSYVPQTHDVFGAMTVDENLKMGGYILSKARSRERVAAVMEILPALKVLRSRRAETLSGGERKMVAIGRALVAEPSVLIVDEPTAGLAPEMGRRVLSEVLPRLTGLGVAVIVVEQRVKDALAVADWCHVLVGGKVALSCPAAQAREDQMLGAVMLGSSPDVSSLPGKSKESL